jgi:uncharacterized membrane protein YqjE
MSELVWGIKNGDLDQVKDIVEQKVNMVRVLFLNGLRVCHGEFGLVSALLFK